MTFGTFELLLLVMGGVLLFVYPEWIRNLVETLTDSWASLKTQFKRGRKNPKSSESDPPDDPAAGS